VKNKLLRLTYVLAQPDKCIATKLHDQPACSKSKILPSSIPKLLPCSIVLYAKLKNSVHHQNSHYCRSRDPQGSSSEIHSLSEDIYMKQRMLWSIATWETAIWEETNPVLEILYDALPLSENVVQDRQHSERRFAPAPVRIKTKISTTVASREVGNIVCHR
jgi:hypothetical protein